MCYLVVVRLGTVVTTSGTTTAVGDDTGPMSIDIGASRDDAA